MSNSFEQTELACRSLVKRIEELRTQRWNNAIRQPHPSGKKFTQEEFINIYSSYKALQQGRVNRPPRRETLMHIADYLECSLFERNSLLLAARYAPEQPYLAGAELESVLGILQHMLEHLSLPAYIVTRDWNIRAINTACLELFGLAEAQFVALPAGQRTILHLLFDPALPVRLRLSQVDSAWERTARCAIASFKQTNVLAQHDSWYKQCIEGLKRLPDFADYWDHVGLTTPFGESCHTLELLNEQGNLLHFSMLHVLVDHIDYPQIQVALPAVRDEG